MRLGFFILTCLLAVVVGIAVWKDANPQWRRYQRTLRDRSEATLLAMRADAQAELERPIVRSLVSSIDLRLAALESDSTGQQRNREIASRLDEIGTLRRRLRHQLREEESRLASPELSAAQDHLRASLDQAHEEYAGVSALWPPTPERRLRAEMRRDSISASLDQLLRPVIELRSRLDSLRLEDGALRDEFSELERTRSELQAERQSYFERLDSIDTALATLRSRTEGVREIVAEDGSIARCPTCHGDLRDVPPAHPRLQSDAFTDVPCTACHAGNGRALDVERAHVGLRRPAELALDRLPPPQPDQALVPEGLDAWLYSPAGRPLRYVGSRECLSCHETLHREHAARWTQTKFRSLSRLASELHPEPCFRCHATGYDSATGTYAEAGVTCEACHGPGEVYSRMMFDGVALNGRGETSRGRDVLEVASRLARQGSSARTVESDAEPINVCVSCHNPRRHRDGGPSILERDAEGMAPPRDASHEHAAERISEEPER